MRRIHLNSTLLKKIFVAVFGWRIFLFFLADQAKKVFPLMPSFPYADVLANTGYPSWLYSWANFDGVHYITIIQNGYVGTGLIQAFFPAYPLVVKLFVQIGLPVILAGIFVSFLFSVGMAVVYFLVANNHRNSNVATHTLISIFLFPTAFFMGALYTEALFLFLVACCFLGAQKKWWLFAAVAAGVASATRVVGIALVPYVLIEYWQSVKKITVAPKFIVKGLLLFGVASAGLLFYMLYLRLEFSDPLYFLHVQSEFGGGRQESLVLYPQVVWRAFKILLTADTTWMRYLTFFMEFLAGVIPVVITIIFYNKLRFSELVYILLVCLIPTSTGTFSSMPRYVLAALPLFLLLGEVLARHRKIKFLYLTVSVFLLIINTMLFVQGYWVA